LIKIPVKQSIYDLAGEAEIFTPKSKYQQAATCIQRFTSTYPEHHHFEGGN